MRIDGRELELIDEVYVVKSQLAKTLDLYHDLGYITETKPADITMLQDEISNVSYGVYVYKDAGWIDYED